MGLSGGLAGGGARLGAGLGWGRGSPGLSGLKKRSERMQLPPDAGRGRNGSGVEGESFAGGP